MKIALAIALGGALGSVGRFYVMGAAERWLASLIGAGFPYGTLTVNVVGSFILGALVQGLAVSFDAGEVVQRFLFVGLLGGFTTFSAFSADSIALLERGRCRPGAALHRALGRALGRRLLLRAQAGTRGALT